MLDEDLAAQMVDFVLQADGEQVRRLDRPRLAVEVEIAHDDVLGAFDLVVDAGHRQTALLADLNAVALDDLRIDQHQQLVPLFRDVDDDDAFVHVDLRRGQTDARRFVHRFGHVARQTANAIVNFCDGRSDFFQARIGKTENG